MTQQNDRDTQAPYQGMMAGLDLVHVMQQGISVDVQLALIDKSAYLWARLAAHATSAVVAETVSTAYTAISHERTALDILSTISLDRTGAKQEDLPKSIECYNEIIMYLGFSSAEWSGTANDLYKYAVTQSETLDQATVDLSRQLVLDALAQSNRLTALQYRVLLLQSRCYEQLLYPSAAQLSREDAAQ